MNNLIIYHAKCLDGTVAAAVTLDALKGKADMWAAAYDDYVLPDVRGKTVYIVDFSYPRETLVKMFDESHKLVVLDHHKTAQEDLAGLPYVTFDMERSGAGLAWDYFHQGIAYPPLVAYVQDYDLWRFEMEDTRAFCMAFEFQLSFYPSPQDKVDVACKLLSADSIQIQRMIVDGACLLKQFTQMVERICENAYPIQLLEYPMLAVNAPGKFANEAGNLLARRGGPNGAACVWYSNGYKIRCMLRSVGDMDVSEIARAYGGGGHMHAAGFKTSMSILTEVAWSIDNKPKPDGESAFRVWDPEKGGKDDPKSD